MNSLYSIAQHVVADENGSMDKKLACGAGRTGEWVGKLVHVEMVPLPGRDIPLLLLLILLSVCLLDCLS